MFKNRLSDELKPRHELVRLSKQIPWETIETEFAEIYVDNGLGGTTTKASAVDGGTYAFAKHAWLVR